MGLETIFSGGASVLLSDGVFFAIAFFAILASLMVVISKNLFHSAIFLAGAFLTFGMIYIYLGAVFVGAIQILIYAGAMTMLLMFVIMLTKSVEDDVVKENGEAGLFGRIGRLSWEKFGVAILALVILMIFLRVLVPATWNLGATPVTGTIWDIANLFLGQFLLPFEVVSVLLLIALIGSIVLARTDDESAETPAGAAAAKAALKAVSDDEQKGNVEMKRNVEKKGDGS